jgi:bifunctional UDP-N-acetylglucosamine pyrophosphorylase/glucosamine-1-phosphate N-acetyltransferase
LRELAETAEHNMLSVLTISLDDPQRYGRILRNGAGQIAGIVEFVDASDTERKITEINTGFIAAHATALSRWLKRLSPHNAQGEEYLTDVIGLAVDDGIVVGDQRATDTFEVLGVNTKNDLALIERRHQQRKAEELMQAGVTLIDPARFDLRGTLRAGEDCEIDINVIIAGDVVLGDRVKVGPNVIIKDSQIGDGTVIEANSVIESATVDANCKIGPFARLRPEAHLEDEVRVGNFVEIKKSRLARGAKANHLAYIGDSLVGKNVNIGAGVITCNYDGANKHQTIIEDNAFIGSNCALVAPVIIGEAATVGAGSTISRQAPADKLTLTRVRQQSFSWQRPKKKE